MSINAETLAQARQALIEANRHNLQLLAEQREQCRKIADLEREAQKQAGIATQARYALSQARIEIDALRTLLPNDATQRAFDDLLQYLSAPAGSYPDLQVAA